MFQKNVRLLSVFNFLIGLGFFAPVAIIYFSQIAGSYFLGSSVFGIIMLATAVFEVPTGILSDRMGRRMTVILGSWSRVCAYFAYAVGASYWWLVAGAVWEGISRAFYSGNNDALLHDSLEDDGIVNEYHTHLGKTTSMEHLASGIAGVVGSIIASISFPAVAWLTALLQCGLVIVSYQFLEPRSRSESQANVYGHLREAMRLFARNKRLRILSVASIMRFALGEMRFQFRAAFINTIWPIWAIGLTNTISHFGAASSFYFSGRIIRRFGELRVLMFHALYNKVLGFVAYGIPTWFSPILLMTPSLLHGVGSIAENKLLQDEFSEHQRATMSSLNSFAGNIAFFFTSLLLGGLADVWGPARAMVFLVILEIPVIYLYLLLFRESRPGKNAY